MLLTERKLKIQQVDEAVQYSIKQKAPICQEGNLMTLKWEDTGKTNKITVSMKSLTLVLWPKILGE